MPIKILKGLLALAICLPIFAHLDEMPIQIWDEARVSANTLEMLQHHNWLVATYNNAPDMWSTKPPLLMWLQAISIKIFGVSELAVRMPSALAALFTCVFIYWFFAKKIKTPMLGAISVLVLITTQGYISLHGARTGDYDSLLTLFTTMYCLYYFLYLEEDKVKYLNAAFACIILAGLTKGVEGMLFIPFLFIYTIFRKKLFSTIKRKQLYVGLGAFIFFVVGYYLLREYYNPGYLKAVQENELGGRFSTVIEGHGEPASFYYDIITADQFKEWAFLLPFGLIAGLFLTDRPLRRLCIYLAGTGLLFFIIISMASTKLSWYTMPICPFMAMVVALFIYSVFIVLKDMVCWEKYFTFNLFPYVFLLIVFATPYRQIMDLVLSPLSDRHYYDDNNNSMVYVLSGILSHGWVQKHMKFAWHGYEGNIYWYREAFKMRGKDIVQADERELQAGDEIAAYQDDVKKYIEAHYEYYVALTHNTVNIYHIHGPKDAVAAK